jgi:hypothetical protein
MLRTLPAILPLLAATPAGADICSDAERFDIVVIAGQSNAYFGAGGPPEPIPGACQAVPAGDAGEVRIVAADPLAFSPPREGACSFAETLAAGLQASRPAGSPPLLIVPAASAGAGITTGHWGPDGALTTRLAGTLAAIRSGHPGSRVAAFAWQGGETDTGDCCGGHALSGQAYVDQFSAMLEALAIGEDVPVLLGPMPPGWVRGVPDRLAIDAAQRRIARERPNAAFVSAEEPVELGLQDEPPGTRNDALHYSCSSQHELGRRYLDALTALTLSPM